MSRFLRTYEQAIEFLFGRINYERLSDGAYSAGDLKLERMRQLLASIGHPQERLPVVHIAGTKGKGSTSVMTAEILSAAGYRTGLFTSPHVSAFEERMVVDGSRPTPEHLVDLVNRLIEPVDEMDHGSTDGGPTYFELATALAWLYFLDRGAEIAVLEVGLGGRLDATNVCHPLVTVITNISRDHTNILGSTIAQIAREKAGIVKTGVPLVSGVAPGAAGDVIQEVCRSQQSALYRLGEEIRWRPDLAESPRETPGATAAAAPWPIEVQTPWTPSRRVPVPLRGSHQGDNTALSVAAVDLVAQSGLPVPADAVPVGLARVRWPARIEVVGVSPTVVVDAAHNWAATAALVRTLETQFSARRRLLIFATTRDKDVGGMLRLLLPRFDTVILTQYQTNPRCVPVHELAALVQATSERASHVAADPASAWRLARHLASASDLVCVTGSIFIAAELRELILDDQRPRRPASAVVQTKSEPAPRL
jgi:dihydrofolate synthase / folylpolyglutamate synthase